LGKEPQPGKEPQLGKPTAVVIGAGLAGATAARALAERGIQITVLEHLSDIAQGASGNAQAVLQMRLNKQADTHWQFHLHSYLYALRFYDDLARIGDNAIDWHSCGVLTLDSAYTNTRHQPEKKTAADTAYAHYPSQLLHRVSAEQTRHISGISLPEGGFLQPRGGWLNPAATCRLCLEHPLITVRHDTRVAAIGQAATVPGQTRAQWLTYDSNGHALGNSDILVIANSYAAREFSQTSMYPVSPLRGQITEVPANNNSAALNMVVCSERYLAPQDKQGQHCIGASYVKGAIDTVLTEKEQDENLEKSAVVRAQLKLQAPTTLRGRASIRGSSGDYMPIAGPVPDPALPDVVLPGLFISTGHGSHGTASCPLLAEHIACLALGEASPLPAPVADSVAPMRFIRRQRRRQQNRTRS
ncbi:MAG: FAD-dependent 5-carboxymethylaminomethyl-2-thiouridine(34) oxidoreductase MnmC, partial [Pseudohongiella sp.]